MPSRCTNSARLATSTYASCSSRSTPMPNGWRCTRCASRCCTHRRIGWAYHSTSSRSRRRARTTFTKRAWPRRCAHARNDEVERMAFGDLFLEDVRAYREANLAGTGIKPVFPLWNQPTDRLAREMLDAGVRAVITCVDPRGAVRRVRRARLRFHVPRRSPGRGRSVWRAGRVPHVRVGRPRLRDAD